MSFDGRFPPRYVRLGWRGDGHATSELTTTGREFETTNRSTGRFRRRRLFAASISLNALRFIVAILPLW